MPESLVDFIRKTMRDKGLTYKKVEENSSPTIATGSLSGLLNGPKPNPTIETLTGLATGLGVDLEEIVRIAFGLKPLADDPIVQEFIVLGKKYAQLDDYHRERAAFQKGRLEFEIDWHLRHQRGEIDDMGNPTTGDGIEAAEGTNGR